MLTINVFLFIIVSILSQNFGEFLTFINIVDTFNLRSIESRQNKFSVIGN